MNVWVRRRDRVGGMLLGLAAVLAVVSVAIAQGNDPLATASVTEFSAPTPPGWTVAEEAPVLRLTLEEPQGDIRLTAVEPGPIDATVLAALRAWVDSSIDAAFAQNPAQVSPANLPTGPWTQRIYLRGDEVVALLTLEREDATYLLLARGSQTAFAQALNAAVSQVLLGLEIHDAEGTAGETAPGAEDDAFTAEEVTVEIASGTLHGTLVIPRDVEQPPVALIVAGSGPTDRNGNSLLIPGRNDSLELLAEGLARQGIASLRYDKRGVGESAAALGNEADLVFDDLVGDAARWLDLLAADDRFGAMFVVGHSEGSLIGMLAAERAAADGFVSLAGSGQTAGDLLRTQLADNLPANLLEEATTILDALEAGETVADASQELASLFRPSVQPYLISWFRYDPAEVIARLEMPVLIVQGTTDIQVSVADAELLAAADEDAELVVIEDMNHVLKSVPAGEDPMASYGDPTLPLANGLVDAIARFVRDADGAWR